MDEKGTMTVMRKGRREEYVECFVFFHCVSKLFKIIINPYKDLNIIIIKIK